MAQNILDATTLFTAKICKSVTKFLHPDTILLQVIFLDRMGCHVSIWNIGSGSHKPIALLMKLINTTSRNREEQILVLVNIVPVFKFVLSANSYDAP